MNRAPNQKVGIIGLGIIGSGIASALRNEGVHVYVWNRTQKPEPDFLGSLGEMADLTDLIQIFVRDGEALREVLEGLAPRLRPEHIILNHATVAPKDTEWAAELVQSKGAAFLDAPFTGSKIAAKGGALAYYVGGDKKVLEKVRPILEKASKHIVHVGKIGDATVLKIATNMISATTVQVLSEALAVVRSQGLSMQKMVDAMEVNACSSGLTSMKLPSILESDFEPHFSLKNMFKDAQFALDMANDAGIQIPALSATAGAMFAMMGKGEGEKDYSVLVEHDGLKIGS